MKKYIKNSLKERIAVRDILAEVLTANEDGTWTYAEGVNDRSVAAGMGFKCTENIVAGVRKEMFGPLRPVRVVAAPVMDETMMLRVSDLEARVARLEAVLQKHQPTLFETAA